jgi:hypothetical protein
MSQNPARSAPVLAQLSLMQPTSRRGLAVYVTAWPGTSSWGFLGVNSVIGSFIQILLPHQAHRVDIFRWCKYLFTRKNSKPQQITPIIVVSTGGSLSRWGQVLFLVYATTARSIVYSHLLLFCLKWMC